MSMSILRPIPALEFVERLRVSRFRYSKWLLEEVQFRIDCLVEQSVLWESDGAVWLSRKLGLHVLLYR